MISIFNDYAEPSPSSDLEGRLCFHSLCMKWNIATECASELTEKLPCPGLRLRVLICVKRRKNSYFLGSKGLTRDYLPYNSTI